MDRNDFIHRYVPGAADAPTLLLLHGTGGDENDLLVLGAELLPNANLLSPRGRVQENGMPRFFRRLAAGVFDQVDLARQTDDLARFVQSASDQHHLDPSRVFAVGYSNGANIAASLLLRQPQVLRGAVLLRPMIPFVPETLPNLTGVPVLVLSSREDDIVPPRGGERLAHLLRDAGAEVQLSWQPGGHRLGSGDVAAARTWLEEQTARNA